MSVHTTLARNGICRTAAFGARLLTGGSRTNCPLIKLRAAAVHCVEREIYFYLLKVGSIKQETFETVVMFKQFFYENREHSVSAVFCKNSKTIYHYKIARHDGMRCVI